MRLLISLGLAVAAIFAITIKPALALTPQDVLESLKKEASSTPGFQGFSATRGENFYKTKHGNELSCSSCHTDNPSAEGKHAKSDKLIKPLAPAANPERFTDMAKIEKWFRRNCNDVLDRLCTAQEKGDFLSYLMTIKK